MANEAGSLGIVVSADTSSATSAMSKLAQVAEQEMGRVQRAAKKTQDSNDAFVASAERQVATYKMAGAELMAYEAKTRGLSEQMQPLVDKYRALEAAHKAQRGAAMEGAVAMAAHGAGTDRASGATAGFTRELLVLGHELSQGNYKRFGGSLIVLAEYSGAATRAMSALVGPIGVVVGMMALVGYEAIHGALEQDKFNKALITTGNYAGLTADRFNAMAAAAAKASHATIGESSGALLAAAGTGRFGPEQLESITRAALLTSRATGQTAEEVVKDFATMGDGVAKWALEHNKSMHFMDSTLYDHIRRLEETGKAEEAMQLVVNAWTNHNKPVIENLGYLATAWDAVTGAISGAMHALQNWGKTETGGAKLLAQRKELAALEENLKNPVGSMDPERVKMAQTRANALRDEIALQEKLNTGEAFRASEAASRGKINTEGAEAVAKLRDMLEHTRATVTLKKELLDLETLLIRARRDGTVITEAEEKALRASIVAKHQDPDVKRAETEYGAYLKRLRGESAMLAEQMAQLKEFGKVLDTAELAKANAAIKDPDGVLRRLSPKQQNNIRQAAKQVDADHDSKKYEEAIQAALRMASAMTAEANARKLSARAEFVARELSQDSIRLLDKESAAYKKVQEAAHLKFTAMVEDPAISKLQEVWAANARLIRDETDAIGEGALAMEKAKASAKIYSEAQKEINAFPERRGEIQDRRDAAIREEKRLLQDKYDKGRDGNIGLRVTGRAYLDDATNDAKNKTTLFVGSMKQMEDAFINFAKTGKLSFSSLFSFMAEEYLRQVIRMAIAKTTLDSAGNLMGLGSIWSGITGFFGHATGLEYVPYDNYPAMLHEGEKVLTKDAARSGGGRGGGDNITINNGDLNVGQGVSRGEVAAALKIQQASTVELMRRRDRTGRWG